MENQEWIQTARALRAAGLPANNEWLLKSAAEIVVAGGARAWMRSDVAQRRVIAHEEAKIARRPIRAGGKRKRSELFNAVMQSGLWRNGNAVNVQ